MALSNLEVGFMPRGCKVSTLQAFGCFVEILPGRQGLVHVSELDTTRTQDVAAAWKVGDEMDVMLLDVQEGGKMKLSR